MKKFLPLPVAVFVLAMATSCEKSYTCTCVYPNQAAGTAKTTIKAYNRSDAKATCADMNEGARLKGGACAL